MQSIYEAPAERDCFTFTKTNIGIITNCCMIPSVGTEGSRHEGRFQGQVPEEAEQVSRCDRRYGIRFQVGYQILFLFMHNFCPT